MKGFRFGSASSAGLRQRGAAILALSAYALPILLGGGGQMAYAAQPGDTRYTPLDADIVVTARRREESAQSVPVALTAIGGGQLEQKNISDILQVQQQVPSLNISTVNPNNTNVNIRGLGANSLFSNVGLENGVGVHIDGVYLARPAQSTFELVDLDRIEILRGPQGTLFGKNTTAGAINIITRAPSFEWEGQVDASVGEHDSYKIRGGVSGPLSDSIAARVSLSHSERGGLIRNVRNNNKVHDFSNSTARGQLLFKPDETFSLRLVADYTRQNQSCCYGVVADLITERADGTPFANGFLERLRRVGYTPLPVDPKARLTDVNTEQRVHMKQYGFLGEATLDLGEATLTSLTSWRKWTYDPRVDADGIGLTIFSGAQQVSDNKQFSQELRIASSGERTIDYVAGLYFYRQDAHVDQLTAYGPDAPDFALGSANAVTIAALDGFVVSGTSDLVGKSYAAFAQGNWNISEQAILTLGLRYNDETKRGAYSQTQAGSPDISGLPDSVRLPAQGIRDAFGAERAYRARSSEKSLTGQVNFAYRFTPDVMSYATYARGTKSGGINLTFLAPGVDPVVGPEKVDHFELGLKSAWLDRRLVLNAALFNTTISDYQATILDPERSASYIANSGKVRSRGFEVEARFAPVRGVNLNASVTHADATFRSFRNAPCAPEWFGTGVALCDLSGRQIPGAPRWSWMIGGDVLQPVSDTLEAYAGADYNHRSSFNTASNLSAYTVVKGYGLLNARAGLRLRDERLDVSVWARNLLDKVYFTSLAPAGFNAGQINGFLGEPRIIGMTVRSKF